MIGCLCRGVSEMGIRLAVERGGTTLEELASYLAQQIREES